MSGEIKILVDTKLIVFGIGGTRAVRKLLEGKTLFISIITEIELLSVAYARVEDELLIRDFIKNCFVVPINEEVKEHAIAIRKKWKVKLPDAIIAASALAHNISLYTADRGFNKIHEPAFKLVFYP
jgi:predicted nucleic acid-binding protein